MKRNEYVSDTSKKDVEDLDRSIKPQKKVRRDFGSDYHPIPNEEAQNYANKIDVLLKHIGKGNDISKVYDIIHKRKDFLLEYGGIEGKNNEVYRMLHDLQGAFFEINDKNKLQSVISSVKTLSRTSQPARESLDVILHNIAAKIPGISFQEEINQTRPPIPRVSSREAITSEIAHASSSSSFAQINRELQTQPIDINTHLSQEIPSSQQTRDNQIITIEEKQKTLQEVKTRTTYNRIKTELRPANLNERTVSGGQWSKDTLKDFAILLYREIPFPEEAKDYINDNKQMRWTKDEADYILRAAFDYKKVENNSIEPSNDWKNDATEQIRPYCKQDKGKERETRNKYIDQSVGSLHYTLKPRAERQTAESNLSEISNHAELRARIGKIMSSSLYGSIMCDIKNEMLKLEENSDRYEKITQLRDYIQKIYQSKKASIKYSQITEEQALVGIFNFIKQERYGEESRRGVNEMSIDMHMDQIMQCIKKQIPAETLQALGLSTSEIAVPIDVSEEISLRNTLKKIDDSAFTNFRLTLRQKGSSVKYKEPLDRLRSVYDFYQGGSTTLTQFKNALKDLIPILCKEYAKKSSTARSNYAYKLYNDIMNSIGKKKIQNIGIEKQYLDIEQYSTHYAMQYMKDIKE